MSTVQGYSVPSLRLPRHGGLHASPGLSGVSLGHVESCPALILAILAQAIHPRWLAHVNDDSDVDSSAYPDAALLDGIPSRILSYHRLSPLYGLMVSRYRRGYAITSTPEGQAFHLHEDEVVIDRMFYAPSPPPL